MKITIKVDTNDRLSISHAIKMLQALETNNPHQVSAPSHYRLVDAVSRQTPSGEPANPHIAQQKAGE